MSIYLRNSYLSPLQKIIVDKKEKREKQLKKEYEESKSKRIILKEDDQELKKDEHAEADVEI